MGNMALLEIGTTAPDFHLNSTPDQKVALSDFRGSDVALIFYPADWSPVCGDELGLFNEAVPFVKKHGATLIGVSVDGPWCHMAFSQARRLSFPLLSDAEPKGAVAKAFHAYREQEGICERALYLIDAQGVIRWAHLSPVGVNPGVDGLLDALEELQGTRRKVS
jgi:peroxiredoxin